MSQLKNESVDIVVTSPPYPMIEMWDDIMANQNPAIKTALESNKPREAFELMHLELDKVWSECWRVLKNGSFLCINIGDATRTIDGEFALYNNNTRIIQACEKLGFINLPNILWRKTTNAPNKFMGSGMLPCGAYVTLEHEWILIFRKGGKRAYKKADEKNARRDSSFFWEERNVWFSDVWEIKGVKQTIDNAPSRDRNASYPLELPYRLINMYSQKGDVVLDPFMGLGTTSIAAILTERNSVGFEIDPLLKPLLKDILGTVSVVKANALINERYKKHLAFVDERIKMKKEVKYDNVHMDCKVMTGQETDMNFHYLKEVNIIDEKNELVIESSYYSSASTRDMGNRN
jgi:DNA modification methylase